MQAKIVRCTRGRIWDVITDLRPNSPTFRKTLSLELTEANGEAVYLPDGVAHGFQSLVDDVAVEYLMSEAYIPELSDGFRYDDPEVGIEWPLSAVLISEQDMKWPPLESRHFWKIERNAKVAV